MSSKSRRGIKQPPHSAGRRLVGVRAAIDPSQIPSVPDVSADDQAIWSAEPFLTCDTQRTIPLATSIYNAIDQGNSSPRFIRATTYAFPHSSSLASACEVPLAAVLQPFAEQRLDELPVPVVDYGPDGPPRCPDCRAYVNPWTTWTMSGQRWVCNICGVESEVPAYYVSPLDHSGRRADLENRPELRHGTVDMIVPREYWSLPPPPGLVPSFAPFADPSPDPRPPLPLRTLIVIDTSIPMGQSGALDDICRTLREVLFEANAFPEGQLVGIMTYASTLNFFDLTAGRTTPSMSVVPDVEEPFSPMQAGMFVDPTLCRAEIESTLDVIQEQARVSLDDRRATFASIQASLAALIDSGGRILLFTSDACNYGQHPIQRRDEVSLLGTDKEHSLFGPQNESWLRIGEELAERGIGLDVFAFPTQPFDLASLTAVSKATGGTVSYHPRYDSTRDFASLHSQLTLSLSHELAYDVKLRVRASQGLAVAHHYGCFTESSTDDIVLGTMSPHHALAVSFELEHQLDTRKDVYVQCAVLYTSIEGQRRVRVLNLAIGTASLAHNVYRFADVHATTTFLVKEALSKVQAEKLESIKDKLTTRCASLLLAYRRQCAASTLPTQLILPETYKLLPVYLLGLLKHPSIRGGSLSYDVRSSALQNLLSSGVRATVEHLYPSMFSIHNLPGEAGVLDPATGWIPLPPYLRPTYMSMESHGVYLIDNNAISILWIGYDVSPQLLLDLFGVDSLDSVTSLTPISADSLLASQVSNILSVLESRRGGKRVPFRIARQERDALEIEFSNLLVEDQNNDAMSYTDYICHVHKLINTALNNNSSIGGSSFWSNW